MRKPDGPRLREHSRGQETHRPDLGKPRRPGAAFWSDRNVMMTRRGEEDAEDRRRRLLEDIAEYLRGEFPDLHIEPPQLPDRRIRALRGRQLVHDISFR